MVVLSNARAKGNNPAQPTFTRLYLMPLESAVNLQDLRKNYVAGTLDAEELDAEPVSQFRQWFAEADTARPGDWFEPNAMTLSTAGADGRVSARIVLLKDLTDRGFSFFTNYQSDKAHQLADNPHASAVFYWPHLERQVRIEGLVEKTDAATSDKYFHMRPKESQIGAVASEQSRTLLNRQVLEQRVGELLQQYGEQPIPRPEYWGGYTLRPQRIEFWQGRPSRLHDRFRYELQDSQTWVITRLAP